MSARLLSAAIVLFWLIMMFSLVKDKILPKRQSIRTTDVDLAELVTQWEDMDEWFRVTNQGRTIGAMHLAISETERPVGYRADFHFLISLKVLQRDLRVGARGVVQLDNQFLLSYFTLALDAWDVNMELRGRQTTDQRLLLQLQLDEERPERFVIALDKEISFLEAVRPMLLRRVDLQLGQSYVVDVIDPIYQMQRGQLVITAVEYDFIPGEDDMVRALRLTSQLGEVQTDVWVDDDGRILRRELMPERELYLEAVDGDNFLRDNPRFIRFFRSPIENEPLEPTDFRNVPEQTFEEIVDQGLFKSLSIVP